MKKLFLFLSVIIGLVSCEQDHEITSPGSEETTTRSANETAVWVEIGPITDLLINDKIHLEAYFFSAQTQIPDEFRISFFMKILLILIM
ncbi:MAG: hypothetical protein LUE93_01385 [Bacteroides sp.]|nr:hypothetical protein [Bacteroides sp.]